MAQPVQYIDLVPTILDLIGAPCAADYAAHGAPMIAASRLTHQFDNRVVVEDVSFEIGPGEIFGLLGPNLAGKSTTLRMLADLISPTSGSITIDGLRPDRDIAGAVRARVGF